jgi:RHS repeat-associated protein
LLVFRGACSRDKLAFVRHLRPLACFRSCFDSFLENLMARLARQLALALFLGASFIVGRSAQAQILEIHSDSLTTYKPTGQTAVQLVRPLVSQRGVNIEGSLRSAPALAMDLQGNPFESVWVGKERQGELRIDIGAYAPFDVDIALPAAGFSWVIGRTYGPLQVNSGASHIDTNGYQGQNWHQSSQPEIILYDDNDNAKDLVYLVYGADRFIEFKRKTESSNQFKATNGAAGCMNFVSGGAAADTYVYTDQHGNQITFFGFDGDAGVAAGQLWKMVDPDANTAYVGHATTSATAISTGYDAGGRIILAYDSGELHRFTYTYSTLDSVKRLTQVKAETKASGTWASPSGVQMVMQVDYAYYTSESYGDIGDLKQATITERLANSTDDGETVDWIKKKYYRYWEGSSDGTSSYNSSTNPGYVHGVKLVVDFEGVRRFDWTDTTFDEDFLSASTNDLKPYAAAYFEYDSSRRVSNAWFNGECGCSGASNGEHQYTYETNGGYSDTAGYQTAWAKRTRIEMPDASYVTQVFDETNQSLDHIVTDIIPSSTDPAPEKWITHVVRDSMGCVAWIHTPANVTGYTHTSNSISTDDDLGLVHKFVRIATGEMIGFLGDRRWQLGDDTDVSNPVYFDQTLTWTSTSKAITDVTVIRPLIASDRAYSQAITSSGGTGSYATSYTYSYYTSPAELSLDVRTTTHATVTTANNGSNSATLAKHHFRKDGQIDLMRTEDSITNFWKWTNGQVAYEVLDANTGHADLSGVTIPSGFGTSGTALHRKTTLSYSAQGKKKKTGTSSANTSESYRSRLADHRLVELEYNEVVAGSPNTYYGPVRFKVINHAGNTEATGVIALSSNNITTAQSGHVDETDADPITASDLGSVAQLTASIYNESGTQLEQLWQYFLIPGSGTGADGTNYDPTVFGYDDSGRRWRAKDASGTIRRTVYDLHGRLTELWIGTNDNSFSGGESSGSDNMVKTQILVYDGGNDGGNHLLTSKTLRVQDNSTGERVTTYAYDPRGNVLLESPPTAPYTFYKYDNMKRRIATGLFSSAASIAYASDDPTTETANRLGLAQTHFDEKGQIWKTTRHKIDDADGSDDNNTPTLTWFDAVGRAIKVDGSTLEKRCYDRLGRQTQRFVLAVDDDVAYADVVDVNDDVVLEEDQTRYDGVEDTVLMTASILRFHNDTDTGSGETLGELDTNADNDALLITAANLEGRVQITGYWYDSLDRLQDKVEFGTYGGSDFDRDGLSVPARSDTALRWTTTYNTDGTVQKVEDPKSLVTFWTYDAVGRKTKDVKHYDSGVNSGNSSGTDDNLTVVYTYVDGLRTTLTADLPSGQTDQVTTYTYGTAKGASAGDSKIATGHLLQKVTYPDSANSSDVVTFAYNARSQQVWKRDQAGNVIETDYDTGGRRTHRRVTTLAGGFDGAIRRISTTYDGLARRQLVTQYDNATTGSGSVTDEVKYTYSDWNHMLEKFEQDRNSTVGAGGSIDDYEISYTFAAGGGGGGRNTVKRASMFLPSGNEISYKYRFSDGKHDLESSRTTAVYDDSVGLAHYEYNGVGHLVGTDLYEADVMWNMFSSTPGDYPDLDRFNRVIKSKWTKDLVTDKEFYSVALTYDRNSNITSADDLVHAGFDVKYTVDDINRLVQAEEGTLSSGSISSKRRDQQWTLTHTGNWEYDKVDLNGDGDFVDAEEVNDHRTHNSANELTARDTDNNASDNYTLTYDAVGNLADDGKDYEYEYDAFGRLRKVKKTTDQSLVAEYRYNGLGHKIAIHADTDIDGDVDSNDKWYYDAFDERGRTVARFRESDTSPKEEFVYHAAGNDGTGRGSYIDRVICRYRDANTSWTSASDGVLEERLYYCQNWRADVSAIVTSTGQIKEWIKYSAYGIPFGLPGGDTDSDGDCDATDVAQVQAWIDAPAYDLRADIDLDGDVDSADKSAIIASYSGTTLGRAVLSSPGIANRKGYAGYEQSVARRYDVRHRSLTADLGRWNRRDPIEVASERQLYAYVSGHALTMVDPSGLHGGYVETPSGEDPHAWMDEPVDEAPPGPTEIDGDDTDPWDDLDFGFDFGELSPPEEECPAFINIPPDLWPDDFGNRPLPSVEVHLDCLWRVITELFDSDSSQAK